MNNVSMRRRPARGSSKRAAMAKNKPAPRNPYHAIIVNPDARLTGGEPVEIEQNAIVRFTICGVTFDAKISGRGLTSFLEVRCREGELQITPHASNLIQIRMGRS